MPKLTTTVITAISKIGDKADTSGAALVVIYGAELGRRYGLTNRVTTIGRGTTADIQIDQESVSRIHAKVTLEESACVLEDLGSTNGTYVNDTSVSRPVPLRNGDFLKIGRTIFKYLVGGNVESKYHEEIYRLTTVDGLTQAYNRRFFEEAIDREISRSHRYGRQLSLVLMDLDHFKRINDSYGHLAGDWVLKEISALMRANLRREDVFARFGGEEFALLLPEIPLAGAEQLAEKARRLIAGAEFRYDTHTLRVTASFGIATLSRERLEPAELMGTADEKLYAAKAAGRNRVCS